jgi:hypothetical protein
VISRKTFAAGSIGALALVGVVPAYGQAHGGQVVVDSHQQDHPCRHRHRHCKPKPTPTPTPTVTPTPTPTETPSPTATPTPTTTIYSLWPSSATPATASAADTDSVELGVRFTSAVKGEVTGIKFYKGEANTGTHIGHLWAADGTQLASATFTGETASGWQDVKFSTPIDVTPDTPYVASYFAPEGGYSFTHSYFYDSYSANPLYAPADSDTTPNGVFTYSPSSTFPKSSYYANNYWVDVDFSTSEPIPTPTATPTPTPSGWKCVAPIGGVCGNYVYAGIPNSNGYNTYVTNQAVGPEPGTTETIYANDPGDWMMISDARPYGYGGVQTFPDVQQLFNNWCGHDWSGCSSPTNTPIDSLTSLKVHYTEESPTDTNDHYEYSPDLWLQNYPNDIMFWVDTLGRCNEGAFGGTVLGHAVIDGQNWTVHRYGGAGAEIIFVLDGDGGSGTCAQQHSGTINIKAGVQWLTDQKILTGPPVMGQLNTGWEITSAQHATFRVSEYTIEATPAS